MGLRQNARGCVRDAVCKSVTYVWICVCDNMSGFTETRFGSIQLMPRQGKVGCLLWVLVAQSYNSSAWNARPPPQQCLTWRELGCHLVHLYSTESWSLVMRVKNLNESYWYMVSRQLIRGTDIAGQLPGLARDLQK